MTTHQDLIQAFSVPAATLERLRARLATAATKDGLVDVAYRTVDTPIGTLLLAATEVGLVRVAFSHEDHDAVLETLSESVSPRVLSAPGRLDAAATELDEYFRRERASFALPLDHRLSRGFRRAVLERLWADVAYGRTVTYAQLAARAGSPRAIRAVGTACATNPIPIVVPCHRVVRSDGTAGGYRGGPDAKRFLLELEASARPSLVSRQT